MDIEVIQRTRDLIAERGHCKGALADEKGRMCLVGAAIFACTGSPYTLAGARLRLQEFADLLGFEYLRQVVDWNNAEETTEQDVLDRLDEAIERMREHELVLA